MGKKKVLVICTVEFSMNGIVSVIMNYFRLCKNDISFDFVVHRFADDSLIEEITCEGSSIFIQDRKRSGIKYIKLLCDLLATGKYDIVHIHGNSSTMAFELFIARCYKINIRIAHCHNSECDHIAMNKLLNPIFNKLYTVALACSEEAGNWIYKNNSFKIIENGIDVKKYCFNEKIRKIKREELGINSNRFVIGHVGLMNEQKNHEKLFEIFKEVKEFDNSALLLCVVGDNNVPEKMKHLCEKLEITKDVIILNSRHDVNELLFAMDFFLFPSRWEGLGLAAIEAQASGLYCLASDNVPKKIDVTQNCSHISLENSAKDWCKTIIEKANIIIEREKVNRIIQCSEFNIDNCKNRLLKIYSIVEG